MSLIVFLMVLASWVLPHYTGVGLERASLYQYKTRPSAIHTSNPLCPLTCSKSPSGLIDLLSVFCEKLQDIGFEVYEKENRTSRTWPILGGSLGAVHHLFQCCFILNTEQDGSSLVVCGQSIHCSEERSPLQLAIKKGWGLKDNDINSKTWMNMELSLACYFNH